MWFLFIIPSVVAAGVAALFTVTTGMNFVIVALAGEMWQKRQGYKPGEGWFSEREGGIHYGTGLDEESDHDISRSLGRLAHRAPATFALYLNKKFDFTKTEGDLLRSILLPAISKLDELEDWMIDMQENPRDEEVGRLVLELAGELGKLVEPVLMFLSQFPNKRVKKL